MDKDFGICARDNEIKQIFKFISDHVGANQAGILYLTGPPGTGKTMSVNLVLDNLDKKLEKIHLNCFKATSSKSILTKICDKLAIDKSAKKSESEMIAQLSKKFSGRTCKPFLMVLDEMDQLPKSSNSNLFRTIFSWTKLSFSKLIIIGIANTLNLTARCQTVTNILGNEYNHVEKIIFKPYSSKDINSILNWYLENDENFEEAFVDPKALDMISKKYARDRGDIRGALNALRSVVDDGLVESRKKEETGIEKQENSQQYPTPPSTPPPRACREATNLASVANSIRKRQRDSHYNNDSALPHHEIILICLQKLCSKSKDGGVDKRDFIGRVTNVLQRNCSDTATMDIGASLEQLEMQGLLVFKKRSRMLSDRIILKASDSEIAKLAKNREIISNFIQSLV